MANDQVQKKLFAGPRIRRIRRDLGLTQARMAEELGISTSYLNLIERSQRPVTAQLLLRLAEVYDIELRSLAGDDEARAFAELNEVFADPLFQSQEIPKQDIQELAAISPGLADAISALYQAYRDATAAAPRAAEQLADRDAPQGAAGEVAQFPVEEVRDFIHSRRNHFPALDEEAEELAARLKLHTDEPQVALRRYLAGEHQLEVRVVPRDVMSATLKRFDRHRRRILLSELLDPAGRVFQMAYQIGLAEHGELIDKIVRESGLGSVEAQRLARVSLANYYAGALLMPYERFYQAAEDVSYDIELLRRRFGTSFEQVCHRLTTMQRPGMRGIPFFLIRVDNAGNVSKRFSASGFHFSKFGGTCPLWNVHDAFRVPGRILTQVVQLPDETTYFSIARTVSRAGSGYLEPDQQLAVGLGCEISFARRLVYAKRHNLDDPETATPIGVNCRMCERPDCAQRAFPPLARKLLVDEQTRGVSPFNFTLG